MLSKKEQQYTLCTSFKEKLYDIVTTPFNPNLRISLDGTKLF